MTLTEIIISLGILTIICTIGLWTSWELYQQSQAEIQNTHNELYEREQTLLQFLQ